MNKSISTKKIAHSYRLFSIVILTLVVGCNQSMAQKKIFAGKISSKGLPSLAKTFKKYSLFAINTGEISEYANQKKKAAVDIELDFPGISPFNMSLNENNLIDKNYQLTVATNQGDQIYNKPSCVTYSGTLNNDKGSKIYLTISDKTIYGSIRGNGKEYFIEPLKYFNKQASGNSFVLYERKDVVPYSGTMCAVTEAEGKIKQSVTPVLSGGTAMGTCKMVRIAIASDASMTAKYDNAFDLETHNISVVNTMVGIYSDAQLGAQYPNFSIAGQYIAASVANDPFLPAYDGTNANTMLTNFSQWGESGRFRFTYDLGQFWTAKNFGADGNFDIIGLAWTPGICTPYRYQILEDLSSLSGLQLGVVAAHETGHNFNASHDVSSGYIMAPSISDPPATTFSSTSLSAISAYLSSITCLNTCSSTPMVASFDLPKAICGLGPIALTRISVGDVGSSTWSIPGGTPASSTDPTQIVTYSTPGLKTVTLTTVSPLGTDIVTKEMLVDNPVTAGCKTFYSGNTELTTIGAFALGDISHNESSIFIGKRYTDNSCTGIASLMTDSVYTVTAGVGLNDFGYNYNNRLQVFIDYNDDGDFTDDGESIYSSDCVQGKFTFTFKTPAAPLLTRLLRLRVIAMPCNLPVSDGCSIPDNAQIEDYAVTFLGQRYAYYVDADMDGLGSNLKVWLHTPTTPPGFSKNNFDCDDQRPSQPVLGVKDHDGDGYYVGDIVSLCIPLGPDYKTYSNQKPGDCDDNNAAIHPGAFEIADGIDNDCNGAIDDNVCSPTVQTKDVTVQLNADGNVTVTPNQVDNGSSDACGALTFLLDKTTFNCGDIGPNTVTLTAKDAAGISSSATAVVTVEDHILPIVTTKNITAQIDASGIVIIDDKDVDDGSYDICGPVSYKLDKTRFECSNVGPNKVTLAVTDASGNSASETAVVTVEDHTLPIVITKNITAQIDAGGVAIIADRDVDDGSYDPCGLVLYKLDKVRFDCSNVGQNTVTLNVTDANGNTASGTAIVTVEDHSVPTVITKNITAQIDAGGIAVIADRDVDNGSFDACGLISYKLDKTRFFCNNIGPNTVMLTVTDANGNTASGTAIVTVEDHSVPTVITKNIAVQLGADGTVTVNDRDVDNGSFDACGLVLYKLDKTSFTCLNVGENTVTLTVTDANGNTASGNAIITVQGNGIATWVLDKDTDGYYTGDPVTQCVAPAAGYVVKTTELPGDCDDNNNAINPATIWYKDTDNDGYSSGATLKQCLQPAGYKLASQLKTLTVDCNDNDASVFALQTYYQDSDGDGYGNPAKTTIVCSSTPPAGYVVNNADCNDSDPGISPIAVEVCGNKVDDNCNRIVDESVCYPCQNAINLKVTNITANSAQLSWTATANPVQWQLQYKTTNQGSKWLDVLLTGNIRTVILTGLKSNQNYQWQIRAKCGNSWTIYSIAISFKTTSSTTSLFVKSAPEAIVEEAKAAITLHPNPTSGSFNLSLRQPNKSAITAVVNIRDISGRLIKTDRVALTNGLLKTSMKLPSFASSGMYMVEVIVEKEVYTSRIIMIK